MGSVAKRRIRMQVRATPDAGEGTFTAKVSTYNLEYDIGWGWTEQILPGAFADSIAQHAALPIFYNHNWDGAPIGVGEAAESDSDLTVTGHLYLDAGGDLVARVWQAMRDGSLEEWSIGFWPETILNDQDNRMCDQIVKGDLAEASVCIRGANPDTGTIDLAGRKGYIAGDQAAQRAEVARLRSLFTVPDLRAPRRRADGETGGYQPEPYRQDDDELVVCPSCGKRGDSDAGWCDQCGHNLHLDGWRPAPYHADPDERVVCPTCGLHNDLDASWCDQCGTEMVGVTGVEILPEADDTPPAPDDDDETARARAGHTHSHRHTGGTVHSHAHTHSGGNYDHGQDALDPDFEVTHDHAHPTGPGDDGEGEDPGPDQSSLAARALGAAWARELHRQQIGDAQ